MICVVIVACLQILLSTFLVLRNYHTSANMMEGASSAFLLVYLCNGVFTFDRHFAMLLAIVLLEYLFVHLTLIAIFAIMRIHSFNVLKIISNKKSKKYVLYKKRYSNPRRLNVIRLFYKSTYFPRLKLGLPGMANKAHPITNVRFDSKGFPVFKSFYTIKLSRKDFCKSREQHFRIAGKRLYNRAMRDYKFRANFTPRELKSFANGDTPSKYVWHHHQDSGVLQLVNASIHEKTHHIGGYSIWGGN